MHHFCVLAYKSLIRPRGRRERGKYVGKSLARYTRCISSNQESETKIASPFVTLPTDPTLHSGRSEGIQRTIGECIPLTQYSHTIFMYFALPYSSPNSIWNTAGGEIGGGRCRAKSRCTEGHRDFRTGGGREREHFVSRLSGLFTV